MKYFKVYKMELAAKLMLSKFVLLGLEDSKKRDGWKVYLFKDSEELRSKVDELSKSR